jgi:hypothetical protein
VSLSGIEQWTSKLKTRTKASIIFILLIFTIGFLPTPVGALNISSTLSESDELERAIDSDGEETSVLRELEIDNLTTLQIVQQPNGNINFVTPLPNYVTAFQTATEFGTIGLLAHNYLAGRYFFQVVPGQEIELTYSDNRTSRFVVTQIQQYQAISPNSPSSNFINLNTGKHLTASNLFKEIYTNQTERLVLQTCIYKDQNPTWGRMFIIAEQIE